MPDRAVLARILPFALYMGFIVITDGLSRIGWTDEQLRWMYAVKIAAVIGALWFFRHEYTELGTRLKFGTAIWSVLAGAVVFVLWINLDAGWMKMRASGGFDPRVNQTLDWKLVCVRWAGAALVVPLMEELFWRSFLMRWVQHSDFINVKLSQVKSLAFLVTVILFGIEHSLWFAGVVAGVVYGWLYIRSENLWSPVLAHTVTNGVLGVWVVYTGSWSYW